MRRTWSLAWVFSLLVVVACGDDNKRSKCSHCGDAGSDGGAHVGGVIEGLVQTTDGKGIPNATVSIGTQKVTTDKSGLFRVEGVDEGTVQVALDDKGLSKAQTEAKVVSKEKTIVALTADETVVVAMDNAEKGGVAIDKGDVRVEISENSLKKSDGSLAKGTVEVHYTVVSVPQKAAAAPGGLKAVDGDKTVQLAPSGLIDVRFYQGDERLTFVGEAALRFPLGHNEYKDGDEISIWSFDELVGRWRREGRGRVVRPTLDEPGQLLAQITHFSWWAAAEPLEDPTCVSGQLRDAQGEPVPNAHVAIRGVDTLLYVEEESDADGSFCLPAHQDAVVAVWGLGASGDELFTWSWQATLESEAAQCGGACTELPGAAPAPLGSAPSTESDAGGGDLLDAGADEEVDEEPDASQSAPDAGEGEPDASVGPEDCMNGVDDNGDGLTDCEDPLCPPETIGCTGLTLDGDFAYVSTRGPLADATPFEGTVELWVRPAITTFGTIIDLSRESCDLNIIDYNQEAVTVTMRRCSGGVSTPFNQVGPVPAGVWTHVAHVWGENGNFLYLNGELADQSTGGRPGMALPAGGVAMTLGIANVPSAEEYFQGDIDEVRIWSVARTQGDIASAMAQSLPDDTQGLIAYYRFDEGMGEASANVVAPDQDDQTAQFVGGATWFPPPPIITTLAPSANE